MLNTGLIKSFSVSLCYFCLVIQLNAFALFEVVDIKMHIFACD